MGSDADGPADVDFASIPLFGMRVRVDVDDVMMGVVICSICRLLMRLN